MENFWMLLSLLFAGISFFLWRRIRWLKMDMERVERSKSQLSQELIRAEYLNLGQQIQPHFLFNALNLLLSLTRLNRREELLKALEHLSLFLRSGYMSRPALVVIESELDLSDHYLEIQKMRFGKRLKVKVSCSEVNKKAEIIPYLIQTFIENAFKHGLERKVGVAELEVEITKTNGSIVLMVQDNGPHPKSEVDKSDGSGLNNIRRRLDLIFGSEAGIELRREEEKTQAIAWWPANGKNRVRRAEMEERNENSYCG